MTSLITILNHSVHRCIDNVVQTTVAES